MSEAISSGEWVDILVSGVSDSMKQLEVYYSCSLSRFLCKFWLLLWSCIIDGAVLSTGLLSMEKWTDICVEYLSLVAGWSVIINLTLAPRVTLLFPGRGKRGGEGKTRDPGNVVTLILKEGVMK